MHSAVPAHTPQLDKWRITFDTSVPVAIQNHEYEDALMDLMVRGLATEAQASAPLTDMGRDDFVEIMARSEFTSNEIINCALTGTLPPDFPSGINQEGCIVSNNDILDLDKEGTFSSVEYVNFSETAYAFGRVFNIYPDAEFLSNDRMLVYSNNRYIPPTILGFGTRMTWGDYAEFLYRIRNVIQDSTNAATSSNGGYTLTNQELLFNLRRDTNQTPVLNSVVVNSTLQVGDTDDICDADAAGTIMFDDETNEFMWCDGSAWSNFSSCLTDPDAPGACVVQIGDLWWYAQNYNVGTQVTTSTLQPGELWCYNNDSAMCDLWGGLYSYERALEICDGGGWRLPTWREWNNLINDLGGNYSSVRNDIIDGNTIFGPAKSGMRRNWGAYQGGGEEIIHGTTGLPKVSRSSVGQMSRSSNTTEGAAIRCVKDVTP